MNHLGYPILIIESPGILGYIVNIKRPFSEWQKIQMSNEFEPEQTAKRDM